MGHIDNHHDHDSKMNEDELVALIKYLTNHNESHANELLELAMRLKASSKEELYQELLLAVEDYKRGNTKLRNVLNKMESGK